MRLWLLRIARLLWRLAATTAAGGLLTATLVRTSPGFGMDERTLDPRFSSESQAAIRTELGAGQNVLGFYVSYLRGLLHGDFGTSPELKQPISELIVSRLPVTAGIVATGVGGGWAMAFTLAAVSVLWRRRGFSRAAGALSVATLCLPSAALAVLIFNWGGPVRAIVALVLFARLFEYIRNLLGEASARPHVTTARAMGIGPVRILFRHVIPVCFPELLALAGVSFTLAFGASIPVETLCDLPGIGQLAWKAAISRDLPTLVVLAMLITLATQLCNTISDWLALARPGEAV